MRETTIYFGGLAVHVIRNAKVWTVELEHYTYGAAPCPMDRYEFSHRPTTAEIEGLLCMELNI